MTIAVFSSQEVLCQQTGDDFKRKLHQSLKSDFPGFKPELKYQPQQVEQYNDDVLKVSPTTKLPTKYDDLLSAPLPPDTLRVKIDMPDLKPKPLLDKIDYSNKKMLPDAVPSSLQSKILRPIGPSISIPVGDLDPVRAIQAYKRAKRQKKIDRIKKVYSE
jgi:hypothetical protein